MIYISYMRYTGYTEVTGVWHSLTHMHNTITVRY